MRTSTLIWILVLLVIIGAGAYMVLRRPVVQAPQSSNTTSSTTASSTPQAVVYDNSQYGFKFPLPDSWRGYSIVNGTWQGTIFDKSGSEVSTKTGPEIMIRHPLWTSATPRQDIPIMIFTLDEWNLVIAGQSSTPTTFMSVSAAPIPPSELGRNAKYVFALPARYNYAFPTGWEEVQTILSSHPLTAYNP